MDETRPDVAELQRQVAALEEELDKLRLIADLLPIYVSYVGADDRYQFVNRPYAEAVGFPRDELVGQRGLELAPQELRDLIASIHARVFRGETVHATYPVRHPELGERELEVTYAPDIGQSGVRGYVAMGRDVTEDRARQREHALLAAAVESSAEAIVACSPDLEILTWNRGARELFGYAPHEAIGRRPDDFLVPENRREEFAWIRERTAAGHSIEGLDTVRLHKDGHLVDVSMSLNAVRDEQGAIRAYTYVGRDITEQQRTRRVVQRSLDELARSNADLEQFAYIASHDLREPLRMISNYVQLLERRYSDVIDDSGRQFIAYATEGSARMYRILDDLLAWSRVGRSDRPFLPVRVETVVQEAVTNLQLAVRESGGEITWDPLPVVYADRSQLVLIFQNLLANAIKFRGDEVPRVHVTARRENRTWRFSISDNGIGIETSHVDRIFQIFQRLHTRDRYGGSGIGLAVTKRAVERHGGHIWVESSPGEGSTFHFTIRDHEIDGED